jgi:hypothetical protein
LFSFNDPFLLIRPVFGQKRTILRTVYFFLPEEATAEAA